MTRRKLWVLVLGGVGFAISALFSGALGLGRDIVVLIYALVGGAVIVAFFRLGSESFREHLRRHWRRGVLAGLALGALLTMSVMKQPSSAVPSGPDLAQALVWLGLVYGLLDGFLLTVLPVLAVFGGAKPGVSGGAARWRRGATALAASLVVTAAYHLGYVEFRGPQLLQPLVGNTVLTAGYLVAGSMATPLIGHVIMHGAAVLHGMETTSQLPPHYPDRR